MNRVGKILVVITVTFLALLFLGTSELKAAENELDLQSPVAYTNIGSSAVEWKPRVEYGVIHLSISCPDGTHFEKMFKSGEAPFLSVEDLKGKPLEQALYNYELRVIPELKDISRKEIMDANRPLQPRALVQGGQFRVENGKFVSNEVPELRGDRAADHLIYDDLIVTGSICVGFDCANGESFGYDTLKLKENNLRLFFEDTSIGSFPTGDWRIMINDTTSGGASYFSVQDATNARRVFTLETGAPSHSLYVEDYGRVGLGTSIPYVELHIVDGDSPTIRLDQDGSSGWTAQRWDMCGNETNFFVRDVTNGSKLCFRIQPNTPSNTLCMRSDGNVGIGTWSPAVPLELETTGEWATFYADRTDGATAQVAAGDTEVWMGSQSNHPLKLCVNDSAKVTVTSAGDVGIGINPSYKIHISGGAYCDGGAWVTGSSREYKENISTLSSNEAHEALEALNPVRFNYKAEKEEEYLGFIAEDVPELVAMKDRKGMNSMDVVAVLTRVLQDQQKTVKQQQKTIEDLTRRIAELEK